jgi:hypothetical protein
LARRRAGKNAQSESDPAAEARWRYAAFSSALSLWLAFAIADEVFITYQVEGTGLRLFIAQLLTLLAVELLPEAGR